MSAPMLTRPNGKPYRPRKEPEVVEYQDGDDCTSVAVLRTHDKALARRLAADFISEFDLDAEAATTDWWRLIPWDTGSGYDRNFVTDPVNGVPVVLFPHEWSKP